MNYQQLKNNNVGGGRLGEKGEGIKQIKKKKPS